MTIPDDVTSKPGYEQWQVDDDDRPLAVTRLKIGRLVADGHQFPVAYFAGFLVGEGAQPDDNHMSVVVFPTAETLDAVIEGLQELREGL